jgi:protein-tyrosine phosphatase
MDFAVITPKLLVGPCPYDSEEFQQLKSESVTAILSLLSLEDEEESGVRGIVEATRAALEYRNVPVNDFDLLDLKRKLPACVEALDDLITNGHKVYVHCTAGVARSPTVVAAYLHWRLHWPLERALDHLQRARRCYPRGDLIRLAAGVTR